MSGKLLLDNDKINKDFKLISNAFNFYFPFAGKSIHSMMLFNVYPSAGDLVQFSFFIVSENKVKNIGFFKVVSSSYLKSIKMI